LKGVRGQLGSELTLWRLLASQRRIELCNEVEVARVLAFSEKETKFRANAPW
jgi:hypothetical protein